MRDINLEFCADQSVAATFTTTALDFKQKKPNIGMWGERFVLEVIPTTAGTGTGTVAFAIESSDDNVTFTKAVTYAPVAGKDLTGPMIFGLPLKHGRYVRLAGTATGTLTGKVTAYLTNDYHHEDVQMVEGFKVFPIGDDK